MDNSIPIKCIIDGYFMLIRSKIRACKRTSVIQGVGAQAWRGEHGIMGAAGVICTTPVQRSELSKAARYTAKIYIQNRTLIQQKRRTFESMIAMSSVLQFVALLDFFQRMLGQFQIKTNLRILYLDFF